MTNPLLATWETPFGLAPFDAISDEDFAPALEEALAAHLAEIEAIAGAAAPASFANTIEAMEGAGRALDQVLSVFFTVAGSDSNEARQALQREFSPKLAAHSSAIYAHAALFGVYGFLALGFCLLILRYIRPQLAFDEKLMKTAFWWMNGGLILMLFSSLLPIGFIQFYASATEGLWYARSEAFMQSDILHTLRWVRTIGDVIFIIGALAVSWQVVKGVFDSNAAQQPLQQPG